MISNQKLKSVVSLAGAIALPLAAFLSSSPEPAFLRLVVSFAIIVTGLQLASLPLYRANGEVRGWVVARSSLLYISWLLIFFMLPGGMFRLVYLFGSVPMLYVLQRFALHAGETWLLVHTAFTSWGLLLAATGAEHYFKAGGVWLTAVVFACLLALARGGYARVPRPRPTRWLSSLAVALFATEGYLAVLFLPLSYLASGFLAFIWFYVVWLFTYYWQYGTLSRRRIQFYLIFALALALLVIFATPWRTLA